MKQRTIKSKSSEPAASVGELRIGFRLLPPMSDRFDRVQRASRRSKKSIIEECLEEHLPELENKHLQPA